MEKNKMQVLVIDDDKEIREMIFKMLTNENYDVVKVSNGEEAIKLLDNKIKIDIVITDIIMPEKEGIETIRELKRDYPFIKILAISGGGQGSANDYLSMAKIMGANLTMSKPFSHQELLESVRKLHTNQ